MMVQTCACTVVLPARRTRRRRRRRRGRRSRRPLRAHAETAAPPSTCARSGACLRQRQGEERVAGESRVTLQLVEDLPREPLRRESAAQRSIMGIMPVRWGGRTNLAGMIASTRSIPGKVRKRLLHSAGSLFLRQALLRTVTYPRERANLQSNSGRKYLSCGNPGL